MSVQEITDKVKQKAIKNIRYGVKIETISLHATGVSCIVKVKDAVAALRPLFPSVKIKQVSTGLPIITATIDYRTNNLTYDDIGTTH